MNVNGWLTISAAIGALAYWIWLAVKKHAKNTALVIPYLVCIIMFYLIAIYRPFDIDAGTLNSISTGIRLMSILLLTLFAYRRHSGH